MPFQITIEMTETITKIDGVPCRLWRGRTPAGGQIDVFVHRVGTEEPAAQRELANALLEVAAPREVDPLTPAMQRAKPLVIDVRHIL